MGSQAAPAGHGLWPRKSAGTLSGQRPGEWLRGTPKKAQPEISPRDVARGSSFVGRGRWLHEPPALSCPRCALEEGCTRSFSHPRGLAILGDLTDYLMSLELAVVVLPLSAGRDRFHRIPMLDYLSDLDPE